MNGAHVLFWVVITFVALMFVLEQAVEWADRIAQWWERGKR
jgi:hypothetical protein